MKQIIVALACALLLAGCGSDENSAQDTASQTSQASGSNQGGGHPSADTSAKNRGQAGKDPNSDQSGPSQATESKPKTKTSQSRATSGSAFASQKAKRSYALGVNIGNSLGELPVDVDSDLLSQGIADVVQGNDTRLSPKQVRAIMSDMVNDMRTEQHKQAKQAAAENTEQAKRFLAENKQKDGVKVTDTGLQYKVLQKGSGESPDKNDKATVTYVGRLPDGTVFDSTKKDGKPATFPVNAVIPGWTEALQMMKPGAEYKLFIPPNLAYGKRGAGSTIGPNQVLIFDVTLKGVEKVKADSDGGGQSGAGRQSGGQESDSGRSGSAM